MTSVLDEHHHKQLIERIDWVSSETGVPAAFLHRASTDFASPEVLTLCKSFRRLIREHTKYGLLLNTAGVSPVSYSFALGAMFARNYVNVKVQPMGSLMQFWRDGDLHRTEVLLVPDFCIPNNLYPARTYEGLQDLILTRQQRSQFTILFAHSMEDIRRQYGDYTTGIFETTYMDCM